MEYIEIEKTIYLSVDQMNAIHNNFLYLKKKFENLGFAIGEIKDNTVSYDISPAHILAKFNVVEDNIRTIHAALKNILDDSVYYKDFVWEPRTLNRKNEVWRWIDWFDWLKNVEFISEDLTDINGEPITDINGEQIQVYIIRSN